MIKLVDRKNDNFHVEIINKPTTFKDFELEFMNEVYDSSKRTMLIGGKENYEKNDILEVFGKIYKILMARKIKSASIDIRSFSNEDLLQIVMGLILSKYTLKKAKEFNVELELICNDTTLDISEYVDLANNMNITKALINTPANQLTPQEFINYAKNLFKDNSTLKISVINDDEVKSKGMMGLFSVGMGSVNRPAMLVISYKPLPDNGEILGLIGKGVTFDTGGYSLKPHASMQTMKGDMGGAASILSVLKTIIDRKVQKNIVAIFPLCENRISDNSILPGDIITMYDGTTVEVLNTDAEGRLILADAVSYAIKDEKVTKIIDVATLTGAAIAAFGFTITPILSNNQAMWQELKKATSKTGEKFIRLPYYKEHEKLIESDMADLKNIGGPQCGIITAGLFIKHFAKDIPWMHFDIAGTNWNDKALYEYHQKGATGGVIPTIYYMLKG